MHRSMHAVGFCLEDPFRKPGGRTGLDECIRQVCCFHGFHGGTQFDSTSRVTVLNDGVATGR